ncbi:hypothetical protein ANO11243_056490 [Dothideomycetidae sp. 11243]|nr:hypothetical protein ANO11243_056490 [fungal sp. No.11243]
MCMLLGKWSLWSRPPLRPLCTTHLNIFLSTHLLAIMTAFNDAVLPPTQSVLLLHQVRQRYRIHTTYPVPQPNATEFLMRTEVVGLNPIDWKAPDYGFGIPELPYVAGRDAYCRVVTLPRLTSRLKLNDKVAFVSTDYRDLRKATYQQYVVGTETNVIRIPPHISPLAAASFGVAAVTATLALGVCLGTSFTSIADGPDLLAVLQTLDESCFAHDIKDECLHGISRHERAEPGDWVAIWGGSSTCAFLMNQLARLAGLKTILVLDTAKHGRLLASEPAYRADFVVDSQDPNRAVDIVRSLTNESLRFGIDCIGKTTAAYLSQCFASSSVDKVADSVIQPPGGHLVGLTGVPKDNGDLCSHSVPVKIFHEIEVVGSSVVLWLERLLEQRLITLPKVLGVVDGLEGINDGLDKMRRGEISCGRLVANLHIEE